jgi:hemolysin III
MDAPSVAEAIRPALRGVIHRYAVATWIPLGILLVAVAQPSARWSVAVYVVAVGLMLGASALYHSRPWHEPVRTRLRRMDHAGIFLAIAGTYTPFAWIALPDPERIILLAVVWFGALVGTILEVAWIGPRWRAAIAYLALGWAAIWFAPEFVRSLGPVVLGFVALGGLLYTVGAIIYARKKPDPFPSTFGFHEVFHALVTAAACCHYIGVLIVATR